MEQATKDAILKIVARLPDWIRHDLAGKDAMLRIRAEEALAAMVMDGVKRTSGRID